MDLPSAEVEIDEQLVAGLLAAQHPDLAGLPLELAANGWDNAIYLLGTDLCIRLPRRQVAVELIINEQRWLPSIASRTKIPIPVCVRAGVADETYPWPWSIVSWESGETAIELPVSQQDAIATELATFLKQLHVSAPAGAPHNPVRGVPLAQRLHTRQDLEGRLLELWDEAVATPVWDGPPQWVHGDLHPGNILVHNGHLSSVIDFGDLTAGDPATDLATAWLTFGPDARATFREVYRPDEHTWTRARGWAVALGTAISLHSDDAPHMAAIGRHALTQVLLP